MVTETKLHGGKGAREDRTTPMKRREPSHSGPSGTMTLATSVSARLREAILDGDIRPDTHLKLRELSASFGVSLSPLREALSRLATEKLVYVEDQRGFRVAPVSAANCSEIGRIRMELETLALRESIRQGGDEWEGTVVAAFHRLSKAEKHIWTPGEKRAEWERLHKGFHQALISASDMPLLVEICGTLSDMADRYRRLFLAKQPPSREVPAEHKAIYEATLERDAGKASTLLRAHIERTSSRVLAFLRPTTLDTASPV